MKHWIGVDLDGTLAYYDKWVGPDVIGKPVKYMVERVKERLAIGDVDIKIFTARVAATSIKNNNNGLVDDDKFAEHQRNIIRQWCKEHIGEELEITATKDFACIEIWDDIAKQIVKNKGVFLEDVFTANKFMTAKELRTGDFNADNTK